MSNKIIHAITNKFMSNIDKSIILNLFIFRFNLDFYKNKIIYTIDILDGC